jgi:hypothetical protein
LVHERERQQEAQGIAFRRFRGELGEHTGEFFACTGEVASTKASGAEALGTRREEGFEPLLVERDRGRLAAWRGFGGRARLLILVGISRLAGEREAG